MQEWIKNLFDGKIKQFLICIRPKLTFSNKITHSMRKVPFLFLKTLSLSLTHTEQHWVSLPATKEQCGGEWFRRSSSNMCKDSTNGARSLNPSSSPSTATSFQQTTTLFSHSGNPLYFYIYYYFELKLNWPLKCA